MQMKTATVQFCGAGGTSEAARMAGIQVVAAINHSRIAIATHQANHDPCTHYQQDITEIDPDDVPESDLLLTSPECTNHSGSKGKKHYHQFDFWGDVVFDPLDEKSRNTMDDVVRFATAKYRAGTPYKFIVVENVVEVAKWRKYAVWLASMTTLGTNTRVYEYRALYWNSQFFGVPQSRDRMYIVFWLKGMQAPDLEYRPTAFCDYCEGQVQAVQSWKQPLKWGVYREQYRYVCPHCIREIVPHFTPVRSILNLDHLGRPIGGRLKKNIQKNIAVGLQRFPGQQFLYGYYGNPLYRRLDEPVGTIPTVDTWALITPAQCFEETLHRMLSVQEVKACMGFPSQYRLLGTLKEQIWQLGNAVCPPIMAHILARCLAVFVEPRQEQKMRAACSN
jgi:DNA (cytosine-5)-methyltransferase 1